jgi:diacylglycerol kinase (ATP)
VVVNPAAGGFPLQVADTVTDLLLREDFDVARFPTTRPSEAVEVVAGRVRHAADRNEPLDVVMAVGGDGTLREVAEGILRGTGRWPGGGRSGPFAGHVAPALFAVPAGTGNSFYRAVFADAPVEEALGRVLEAHHAGARIRSLDVGRLVERDRAVVLGASVGFLANVVDAARAMPSVTGRQRYEAAALELIGRSDSLGTDARVLVDGELLVEDRLLLVALGGARHRGGSFELLPGSELDDGLFDVCAITMTSSARLLELLLAVAAGAHRDEPEVSCAKGRTVTINATRDQPLPVESDGDVVDRPGSPIRSVTFDVIAAALPVWAADPPVAG